MKQFMIFWKRSDLKMWNCFVVISLNASVQNNGKRGCLIKVLYQELVWKSLLGPVHILESLGTVLNSVGFSFSIPQDGLIRESLHCEIYASTGWIPVMKDASFVASKYYMSIVIGSVSQIMSRYISIDINKASPWIFFIMVSQESLKLYPSGKRQVSSNVLSLHIQ